MLQSFSIHTAHTVSLAANSRRAGSQLELHPLQRCSVTRGAPPHVSTPPLTGGLPVAHAPTARAGSFPALRSITCDCAFTMTSASIRFGPPSLLRSRPVVLSAPSTGARLRRVPTISPLQPWRRAPFHLTNRPGHAGRIGHGSWRLLAIRSAFRRGPWRDSAQYITRPAAHAHPNGGSTPTGVAAGPAHTNGSIGAFRVPTACSRTDDKSVRRDQLRSRRRVLHRPASLFCLHSATLRPPSSPFQTVFSFLRFFAKILRFAS